MKRKAFDWNSGWNSNRLAITPYREQDLSVFSEIYNELVIWRKDVLGMSTPPMMDFVNKRSLPPDGNEDNLYIYLIRQNENNRAIGILALYLHWPKKNSIYIATLYIQENWSKSGYGLELMQSLKQNTSSAFKHIMIRVHLVTKYPPYFFFKMGFKKFENIPPDDQILIASI